MSLDGLGPSYYSLVLKNACSTDSGLEDMTMTLSLLHFEPLDYEKEEAIASSIWGWVHAGGLIV